MQNKIETNVLLWLIITFVDFRSVFKTLKLGKKMFFSHKLILF